MMSGWGAQLQRGIPRALPLSCQLSRRIVTSACTTSSNDFTLLTANQATQLEPLMARDLTLRVLGDDGSIRALQIVVVRAADGLVRGYENNCPHQGGPINAQPGNFFSRRHPEHLICSRHGARFQLDDGYCVSGPCAGHGLHAVPLDTTADGVTIAIDDARSASRFGRLVVGSADESTLSPSFPIEVLRPRAAFPIVDAAPVPSASPSTPPADTTPAHGEGTALYRRPPPLAAVPEHVMQRMRQWEETDARLGTD